MSGHSKWANTKHRKALQDVKRGKVFTKHTRELISASKLGTNADTNPRLRTAIEKALSSNMKLTAVKKAIFRNTENQINKKQSLIYEGYGPKGSAVIISCMSDNKKRTVSHIRSIFNKFGGTLGNSNSVQHLFIKKNIISCHILEKNEEYIMNLLLKTRANDFIFKKNNILDIHISSENFFLTKKTLEHLKINIIKTSISVTANVKINVNKKEKIEFLNFIQLLSSAEDVQNIYHNVNIEKIIS